MMNYRAEDVNDRRLSRLCTSKRERGCTSLCMSTTIIFGKEHSACEMLKSIQETILLRLEGMLEKEGDVVKYPGKQIKRTAAGFELTSNIPTRS